MNTLKSIYENSYDFSVFYNENRRPASYLDIFAPIIPFKDHFKNPPPPQHPQDNTNPNPKPSMFVELFHKFRSVTYDLILNLLNEPKTNTMKTLSASFILMACLLTYYKATGYFDKSVIESLSINNERQLHMTLERMFNVKNLEQLRTHNYIEIVNEMVNPNLKDVITVNLENTFAKKYGFNVNIGIDENTYTFKKITSK